MLLDVFKTAQVVTLPTNPVVRPYEITPAMAKELLDNHNFKNPRNIRSAYWKAYVNDMVNGHWTPAQSDMIVIDVDGNLINGQHRLKAVLESGMPQIFWVMQDAPANLDSTMDNGKPRNLNDYVKDIPHGNHVSTVARVMDAMKNGIATFSNVMYARLERNVTVTRSSAVILAHEEVARVSHYVNLAIEFSKNRLDGTMYSNIAIAFMMIDQLNQSNRLEDFAAHLKATTTTHTACVLVRENLIKCKFNPAIKRVRDHIVLQLLTAYDLFCSGDENMTEDAVKKALMNTADTEQKYNKIIANYRALAQSPQPLI